MYSFVTTCAKLNDEYEVFGKGRITFLGVFLSHNTFSH